MYKASLVKHTIHKYCRNYVSGGFTSWRQLFWINIRNLNQVMYQLHRELCLLRLNRYPWLHLWCCVTPFPLAPFTVLDYSCPFSPSHLLHCGRNLRRPQSPQCSAGHLPSSWRWKARSSRRIEKLSSAAWQKALQVPPKLLEESFSVSWCFCIHQQLHWL